MSAHSSLSRRWAFDAHTSVICTCEIRRWALEARSAHEPNLRKQHIDDIASTSGDDGTTRREARTRKEGHRARTRNKRERTDENERISRALTTDMVASRGRFDLGIELVGAGRGTRCAAEDLRLRKGAPKWGAQLSCGMSGPG
ncbi:hypothetical protein G5I_03579 [Acromyrmex echinatior]|uniref:Uncharacterized protein n=1 Tax=Acromyrmex echinatior TaxID=103372 RepID=F4WDC6_ACREC|nr:hypothetical protein G5I_03579 [Acromyrmex echinatior]